MAIMTVRNARRKSAKEVLNVSPLFNAESHRIHERAKAHIFSFITVTSAIQRDNFGHQIFCKVLPFELSTGKQIVKYVIIHIRLIRVVMKLHSQLGETNSG